MISVLLGIAAALAWGLHDFLGRFVARAIGTTLTTIFVFLSGVVCLTALVAFNGRALTVTTADLPLVGFAGLVYAGALVFLFTALRAGSLALVVLIVASYPATVVVIAIIRGAPPTALQFIGIVALLVGMTMVIGGERPATAEAAASPASNRRAIAFAALSHLCFAVSITIGQTLVNRIDGAELTWIIRLAGLAVIPFMLIGRDRPTVAGVGPWLPAAAAMGLLDVIGLGSVLAAGAFPYPELGPVVSSGYGAVAVVLALVVLRETLTRLQLVGIILSIVATVVLALPDS